MRGPASLRTTIVVAMLLSAACGRGGDRPEGAGPTGGRPGDEPARYLADVRSGAVVGAGTAGIPGAMVVYGGLRGDASGEGDEVLDRGVVVDEGGVRATFSTGVRLVDADVAAVGERIVVAGRRCDGRAEVGDLGVSCAPGTATVAAIDPATGVTSILPLPRPASDPAGRSLFVTVHGVGDRLVVRVIHAEGVDTLLADTGLTSLAPVSEDRRSGATCATGDALVELRPSAEPDRELPPDPTEWSSIAAEPVVLRVLDLGSGTWTEGTPAPATTLAPHHLACTRDRASVVVADPGGPVRALVYDGEAGSWSDVELPAVAGPVAVAAGALSDQVLVVGGAGGATRLTPSTGATGTTTVPDAAGRQPPIVAIGGTRFAGLGPGPPPALEVIR